MAQINAAGDGDNVRIGSIASVWRCLRRVRSALNNGHAVRRRAGQFQACSRYSQIGSRSIFINKRKQPSSGPRPPPFNRRLVRWHGSLFGICLIRSVADHRHPHVSRRDSSNVKKPIVSNYGRSVWQMPSASPFKSSFLTWRGRTGS
jgi:hypothetical protein